MSGHGAKLPNCFNPAIDAVNRSVMSEKEDLVIYPIPSLVALLLNLEKSKGSPLTEHEVIEVRDNCASIAVPPDVARRMDESRGYRDIDPEDCWEEWQKARQQLADI
jgi:hypothetical protein